MYRATHANILRLGIVLPFLLWSCNSRQPEPDLEPATASELRTWLDAHGQPPVDYVLDKFADHDVVILGELHRLKDNPLLVQRLIPRLPERGVHVLATEFARAVDQPLIDSLLGGQVWDEELVREIQLRQYSLWPWREYLDIFKVAWELNRSTPPDSRQFRILGLNCNPDWSVIQSDEDLDNPDKRRAAWNRCTEADWAAIVMREVTVGNKVLAYCGMHHAFSRYRQPRVNAKGEFMGWGDVRFGNHLRDSIDDRVFTIAMHHPWYERTSRYSRPTLRPVGGVIDKVMESRASGPQPVGFDVDTGLFGALTDTRTIYGVGYDHFTLATFCDGYIYFRPFPECELVTFVDGFYSDQTMDLARIGVPQPRYREASPAEFEEKMKAQLEREKRRLGDL